ncbi:alpha/beta hydrolase [Streptomyces sp. NPDC050560]|uniref:alpha/beta hydrolase n=1 Tax=Streptomyces sp. NPDC050560 TaxID=3365630 RepID=UPI0037ADF67F
MSVAASYLSGGAPSSPLIVCLHGGGYTRRYFDIEASSFLRRAQVNGFPVLAVDRPGYGDSDAPAVERGWFPAQARTVDAAIADAWRRLQKDRTGVVLLGHSFGATVALRIAARQPAWPLLGVIVNGTLDRTVPSMLELAGALEETPALAPVLLPPEVQRSYFYGPDGTFDPAVAAAAAESTAPAPAVEIREWASGWPKDAAAVAAHVRVPVHVRVSEHDAVQDVSPDALGRFVSLFGAAPHVDSAVVLGSGHNTDHHYAARALHLEQLAFADRCAAGAGPRSGSRRPTTREGEQCDVEPSPSL